MAKCLPRMVATSRGLKTLFWRPSLWCTHRSYLMAIGASRCCQTNWFCERYPVWVSIFDKVAFLSDEVRCVCVWGGVITRCTSRHLLIESSQVHCGQQNVSVCELSSFHSWCVCVWSLWSIELLRATMIPRAKVSPCLSLSLSLLAISTYFSRWWRRHRHTRFPSSSKRISTDSPSSGSNLQSYIHGAARVSSWHRRAGDRLSDIALKWEQRSPLFT